MELILQRLTSNKAATLGCIIFDHFPRWCTLELPWRNNEVHVSCIPPGVYEATRRTDSSKAKLTWELNVPGRSHILCGHVGNYPADTEGCILFGKGYCNTLTIPYLRDSKLAYDDFMTVMKEVDKWKLHILKEPRLS